MARDSLFQHFKMQPHNAAQILRELDANQPIQEQYLVRVWNEDQGHRIRNRIRTTLMHHGVPNVNLGPLENRWITFQVRYPRRRSMALQRALTTLRLQNDATVRRDGPRVVLPRRGPHRRRYNLMQRLATRGGAPRVNPRRVRRDLRPALNQVSGIPQGDTTKE